MKDRPIAISGLAKRLEKYYKTHITYGIVHRYLHKSLLWQRASKEKMCRIQEPNVAPLPSWSWMSLKGGIRYNTRKLRGIHWDRDLTIKLDLPVRLEAPIRLLQSCSIKQTGADTDCMLRDVGENLVGWMRFDQEDFTVLEKSHALLLGNISHHGMVGPCLAKSLMLGKIMRASTGTMTCCAATTIMYCLLNLYRISLRTNTLGLV
jgi:hypothetical protein